MGLFDGKIVETLSSGAQSVVEKAQKKFEGISQQGYANQPEISTSNVSAFNDNVLSNDLENKTKFNYCSNCGTQLNNGAKFCHNCGAAVNTTLQKDEEQNFAPSVQNTTNSTERQQEYVGKILKCPNCGGVLSETTAVCPDCGMHLTGKTAVHSVQAFKEELMKLDNTRVSGFKGMLLSNSNLVDPVDKRKVTLIQNFPIPNSVDDIIEFMLLAIANIDVGLSKGKWDKRAPASETAYTIKRTISNAWVAKMMQAYKKAEISFPNDPAFEKIQKLYLEKAVELKIIKK